MTSEIRVRRSIDDLQYEYYNGNKKPLEDLMRAWQGIKALPPQDPNSFFVIGGYHGEPFRGAGWGNATYWGGYCNHGNVLFPTWHRAYMLRLEEALRSIPGCADVTMPFWDEASEQSQNNGVPWALTVETFELDGNTIPNPLRSFSLNKTITDHISGDNPNYSKQFGYETVRYPLSGLVGSKEEQRQTDLHNAQFPNYNRNVALLNANIIDWLTSYIEVTDPQGKVSRVPTNVAKKFADCLNAPNYTVFSNTTSAAEWNDNLPDGVAPVMPLEQPHNDVHLAVGGFEMPTFNVSPISGANGDMGENDTAALDPIFYFHHCFIDRIFWLWQVRHGAKDGLEIIEHYPGTNSVDNQGPTPGVTPNTWLNLDSPLDPFRKPNGTPYTSRDLVNIEKLGYGYGRGSLEDEAAPHAAALAASSGQPVQRVHVSGVSRAGVRGSFLISAFADIGGKRQLLGTNAVLSRWHVQGCANCQTHLEARAVIPVHGLSHKLQSGQVDVQVRTRDEPTPVPPAQQLATASPSRKTPRFELR